MKTSSILTHFQLVILIIMSVALFSCKDQEVTTVNAVTNSNLEGDWKAYSYVVLGEEKVDSVLSLTIKFSPSPTSTAQDDGRIVIIENSFNEVEMIDNVVYKVLDNGTRIDIFNDTLEMTLVDSDLKLDGIIFNQASNIALTRQ